MVTGPGYPGVYIDETTAVSQVTVPATTNLTAVLGGFPTGSASEAVLVTSWSEFASQFGQLNSESSLAAYAVWQFFQNGGNGAWIVRLVPGDATAAAATLAPTAAPSLAVRIQANSPGQWGNSLQVAFTAGATGDSQNVKFTVQRIPSVNDSPDPASPGAGTPLEIIPVSLLQADGSTSLTSDQLADAITQTSAYVAARPDATASWPSTAPLAGGSDGTWNDSTLEELLTVEFQNHESRLDQIKPQVFNLMCLPDVAVLDVPVQQALYKMAHDFCQQRHAFLLVDPPPPLAANTRATTTIDRVGSGAASISQLMAWSDGLLEPENTSAATYYPWVQIADPTTGAPRYLPPSGTMAGVYTATDTARGVWKAPAGVAASLIGIVELADPTIDDSANGTLNRMGVNCLRTLPIYGTVAWGARTLAGNDLNQSPYPYVPTRRLSDFIELSLEQSLRWTVFEPNGPGLWSSITLQATAFMSGLFSAGAFAGATAAQASTVVCDATTTTQDDVDNGIINLTIGFAPAQPAEFILLHIQLSAAATD